MFLHYCDLEKPFEGLEFCKLKIHFSNQYLFHNRELTKIIKSLFKDVNSLENVSLFVGPYGFYTRIGHRLRYDFEVVIVEDERVYFHKLSLAILVVQISHACPYFSVDGLLFFFIFLLDVQFEQPVIDLADEEGTRMDSCFVEQNFSQLFC